MGKLLGVAALLLVACGGGENDAEEEPQQAVWLSQCEAPLAPEFGTRGSVKAEGFALFDTPTSEAVSGYMADIWLADGTDTADELSEHVETAERVATHVFPGDSGGWHVANLRVEFDISGASMRLSQVDTLVARNISCTRP